ncbi:hypothetical protein SAMN02745194_04174 [Roseomonas rosea]|uniref:Uncharacterized protein n=1 Tax=Muricoccus roseus TaxID=198092 RepID=A0A1M6PPL1_9PROT|nr:hypothetical protein [Roseomonas rosea]SHK09847.1 hypothetical protein SAMN02745194_04174 [Roseomonas rosea]
MPDRMARDPALDTLAEIANDNLAERLRHEAAARILVAARRVGDLVGPRHGEHLVDTLASGWDPRVVTALEYAEGLPVRVLDGMLGTAPRWARAMRDLIESPPGAAAA